MSIMKQIKAVTRGDTYGRNGHGNIIIRRGYFYTGGKTYRNFTESVQKALIKADINAKVIDSGDHWAPFKGNASVARSSHWWVEIEVHGDNHGM